MAFSKPSNLARQALSVALGNVQRPESSDLSGYNNNFASGRLPHNSTATNMRQMQVSAKFIF
jgi:hypothetical protein